MNLQNLHIHVSYFVIAAILSLAAYVGVHSYLVEHDARLLAVQQEKVSEAAIHGLQDQIKSNNDQIKTLQQSIEDVNAAAQKQVQVIVHQVEAVKTPAQAIDQLDSVSTRPLDARTIPDSPDRASVLVLPLFRELGDCRIGQAHLEACQTSYAAETKIADTNADNVKKQEAIVAEKQKEIDSLKRPKKFWSRVGSTFKVVGIGIGIGLTLGRVL